MPTSATLAAYDQLLRDFASHVGLDPELLVKTQEVIIDGLHIGLLFEGTDNFGDIVYFVNLGAPTPSRAPETYKTLLLANHLWAGTGGATLGLQADTGNIVMAGHIDFEGVTAESLAMLLDAFVENASYWKKFVAGEADSTGSPAPFALRA